ncbi:MAG: hypothetical protein AAB906_01335 [Patescibacteria group bacterium]
MSTLVAGTSREEIVLPKKLDQAIKVVESSQSGRIVIPSELAYLKAVEMLIRPMKAGLSAIIDGGKCILDCVQVEDKLLYHVRCKGEATPFGRSLAPCGAPYAAKSLAGP